MSLRSRALVHFAAAMIAALAGCDSSSSSNAGVDECVLDGVQFTCSDGTKWAECPASAHPGQSCKEGEPVCMGCNGSVGNFTCGCRQRAGADAGPTWECGGTGKPCRTPTCGGTLGACP